MVPGQCAGVFKGSGRGIDLLWKRKVLVRRQWLLLITANVMLWSLGAELLCPGGRDHFSPRKSGGC